MPLLEARGISKTYKRASGAEVRVFSGMSFSVEAGEHVAIVGRSGSGKSTLLNILGGLDRPDRGSGTVFFDGADIFTLSERARADIRAERIGFVFQAFHLMPDLTIAENVYLPAMAVPSSRRPPEKRVGELLEAVGLADRATHKPMELSGGEQQRASIARAMMNSPDLLLADEPTGNLDPATSDRVLDLFFDLAGELPGVRPAVVMVTHADAVAARCGRIFKL